MADPFSGLAEGFQQGAQIGLLARQRKLAEQEAKTKADQAEFDQDVKTISTNAEVLTRNLGEDLSIVAGNNLLGAFRRQAVKLGVDPSEIPKTYSPNPEADTPFIKQLGALTKAYNDKLIGKNDFRLGMFSVGKQWKNKLGKDNASDIMSMAENVIGDTTKPRARTEAQMGNKKVTLQETEPGSGEMEPMTVGGKPVEAPVAPPATVQDKINDGLAAIDTLNKMDELYDPEYVGIYEGTKGRLKSKTGIAAKPLEAEFRAVAKLQALAMKKFFIGTAQSAAELRDALQAIPDPDAGSSEQFEAAMSAVRSRARSELRRIQKTGQAAGYSLPPDLDLELAKPEDIYNAVKDKPTNAPVSKTTKPKGLDDPKYWEGK